MPDAAGRQIDTREELLASLRLAAELEHSLLVQYLFAALSCRNRPSAAAVAKYGDAAWRTLEPVRSMQRELFAICREEMAHLATVCNLLSSVGAAPHLIRPPMEEVLARLYGEADQPIRFALEPFGVESLTRFAQFEAPESPFPPAPPQANPIARAAPDVFDYRSVGGLYRLIDEGFEILSKRPGSPLFVGDGELQDRWEWSGALRVSPVTDLMSARAAIQFIIAEGEGGGGASIGPPGSHFERLRRMVKRFRGLSARFDLEVHILPVIANPATSADRTGRSQVNVLASHDGGGKLLLEYRCAELSNAVYTCMLHLLAQFYDPAGEPAAARVVLAHSAKQTMSGILRPVCELLVHMPATGYPGYHAAPPFELYDDVSIPARSGDRAALLLDRIAHLGRVCSELGNATSSLKRLTYVAENIDHLSANLSRALVQA